MKIIRALAKLKTWHFLLLSVISSEILTLVLTTLQSVIRWGTVPGHLIEIGAVDALLVSFIVTAIIIPLIRHSSKAEAALEKCEIQYQNLVDNSLVGIFKTNLRGDILYVNDALARMAGFDSPADIIKDNVLARYKSKQDRDLLLNSLMEKGKVGNFESELLKKNGESIPVLLSAVLEGEVLTGMMMDITERKRAEQQIWMAKEEWEQTFDAIPDIIAVIDDQHVIRRANRALAGRIGIDRDEVIGKSCYEVICGLKNPVPHCPGSMAMVTGSEQIEERFVEKLKGYYLMSCTPIFAGEAGKTGFVEVCRDISERKRSEQALHESTERLRNLIETTSDWIWEVDENGVYTYTSQKVRDILGYEPEEVLGKTPFDLMPPEEAKRVADIFKTIADSKRAFSCLENINLCKNGNTVVLETSGVPFFDAEGKVCGYRGIDRDITDRKRAEEEIRRLNHDLQQRALELERAYKDMESFSYVVSHDLKAPARRIEGFSGILLKDHTDKMDYVCKDLLSRIEGNAKMMGQLIDDLLAFSRVGTREIRKSEINMEILANNVFEELKPSAAGRTVQIKINTMPSAVGDASMIRQVITNLLSNALKFTRTRDTAIIEVGGQIEGDEVIFFVRDNGAGFDMKFADKLFGLFQRIHISKEFEGTGIGLVTVKEIIEKHCGRVWAEGRVNEGATFYFSLPGT